MLADFGKAENACGIPNAHTQFMSEASEALKARTENFAVAVVKFCETLPNTIAGRRIAQQLIDASTSVAANYRAACRAYTRPLFVSKLAVVSEEADESELWLRILRRTDLQSPAAVSALEREAHELASIFTASLRTARGGRRPRANPVNPPIQQSDNTP
jgi:four helix bundle protein